jgi:hypothetical protein
MHWVLEEFIESVYDQNDITSSLKLALMSRQRDVEECPGGGCHASHVPRQAVTTPRWTPDQEKSFDFELHDNY